MAGKYKGGETIIQGTVKAKSFLWCLRAQKTFSFGKNFLLYFVSQLNAKNSPATVQNKKTNEKINNNILTKYEQCIIIMSERSVLLWHKLL